MKETEEKKASEPTQLEKEELLQSEILDWLLDTPVTHENYQSVVSRLHAVEQRIDRLKNPRRGHMNGIEEISTLSLGRR